MDVMHPGGQGSILAVAPSGKKQALVFRMFVNGRSAGVRKEGVVRRNYPTEKLEKKI